MQPHEARVFIIDDDPEKLQSLTEFVEDNGGQVVGSVSTREDAHRVIGDSQFPANVGNPNTVLIDGNLGANSHNGTDGHYVFLDGYSRAVLHRVNVDDGIGAVALGCVVGDRSEVVYSTGGNIDKLNREDADLRWADLLDPHPAEPLYLSEGTLERMNLSAFYFGEMMRALNITDNLTLVLHRLSVTETKKENGEEKVTYSKEETVPLAISSDVFLSTAEEWQGVEDGFIKVDSRTVKAVVQAGDYIYVIDHSSKVVRRSFGSELASNAYVDKIAITGLQEMPDSYWEALGIERPTISD